MRYLYLSLLLCLAGCSTISQQTAEMPVSLEKTAYPRICALQTWSMQGAIAVKTPQKGWNASFNWCQKYTNYHLNIFGPLGSNRISLQGNNQYSVLTTSQKTYEAANAETLLLQQLGWYIPVNSFYYWVRGLPVPHLSHYVVRDSTGRIIRLEQQGWRIKYSSYDEIKGLNLPTLIELQSTNVFIRIAIHQWHF